MKEEDKKKILKKIRRDEHVELKKQVNISEKVHKNKKKYTRKRKHIKDN